MNCHTVARYLENNSSGDLFLQSGYLLKIDENGKFKTGRHISIIDLFHGLNENEFSVLMESHSVIKDIDGNYFECLIDDYSLSKYKFISHVSGIYGYQLKAYLLKQA